MCVWMLRHDDDDDDDIEIQNRFTIHVYMYNMHILSTVFVINYLV